MPKIKGGIITAYDRRIFNFISSPLFLKKEFGGYIDFSKDQKLERFRTNIGGYNYVDIDTDYEVLYHTHPTKKGQPSPPSPDDIMVILTSPKQQAHIIFNNKISYIIIPTQKARNKMRSIGEERFEKMLFSYWYSLFRKYKTDVVNMKFENNWVQILEKLGIKIIKNTQPQKDLKVPISIKEPRYTQRTKMKSRTIVNKKRK